MARDKFKYGTGFFDCPQYDFTNKDLCVKTLVAYMINRTQAMFKWDGLPDTIPQRMLELQLQNAGHTTFFEHNGGLYVAYGSLGGEPNIYYQPTKSIISNPALGGFSKTLNIDKDCVVIRNDALMIGLLPMASRYATQMVENEISLLMAEYNSRVPSIISTPTDVTKKAGDEFIKQIVKGNLAIMGDESFLDGIKVNPYNQGSSNGFITNLIEYQQYIKASWFNELGIDSNFNAKRESITSDEISMNAPALLPLVDNMLECRKEACEKINTMFNLNLSVDFASAWKEERETPEEVEETPIKTEESEVTESEETE